MDQKLTKDEKKALRQEEWKEKAERERKQGLYKTLAYWSFGGLLVILGIWALVAFSGGSSSTSTSAIKLPAVTASDFQAGSPSAKATLVEYADFQCPACKAYYPVVKQLQSLYGDKLHFVYRFFPLKTIHRNGVNSAKAAYAASLQSRFWDMHDKLFETQEKWAELADPEATFIGYAKDLSLNTDTFKKDYEASTTLDFVNKSYDTDTSMGLNSTPTFFLNGKQMDNPNGYQPFKDAIDAVLK